MKKYIIRYLPYSCLNISAKIRNYASPSSISIKHLSVNHNDFAKKALAHYRDVLEGFKAKVLKTNAAASEIYESFDVWILIRISEKGVDKYTNYPFKSLSPDGVNQIDSMFTLAVQKFITDCIPRGSSVAIDIEFYSASVADGINPFKTPQQIEEFIKSVRPDNLYKTSNLIGK